MTSNLELNTLVEIQEGILSGRYDLEEASKRILEQACQSVKAEVGQILLLEGEYLVVRSSTTKSDLESKISVNDSVSGLAVSRNETIVIGNVRENETYKSLYKSFLGPQMNSELVVPLNLGTKIIGVINVESPRQNAFNDSDMEILSALAYQAALAFRIAEEIELRKRATEQAKLASIGELSGDIVHRMNSPLGAIRANISLIQEDYKDVLDKNPELAETLSDISRIAGESVKMLREMRDQARQEVLVMVELKESITNALVELVIPSNVILENKILKNKENLHVRANTNLSRVFKNLIINALDAMPTGGRLILDAKPIAEGYIEITVEDTGIGISDDFRDEIFNLLSVFSKKRADGGGHGLGLWYCRAFVEACGGELPPPESIVGKGTKFMVRLPIANKE